MSAFSSVIRKTVISAVLFLLTLRIHAAPAAEFRQEARTFRDQLEHQILPYWYDTAQDKERGGYLLADSLSGPGKPMEKQLVSQSRMIWTFAHVHRKGFRDPKRDYLQAAAQGYHFLIEHFQDKKQGGYFWKMDLQGKVLNSRKIVYGQSFVDDQPATERDKVWWVQAEMLAALSDAVQHHPDASCQKA